MTSAQKLCSVLLGIVLAGAQAVAEPVSIGVPPFPKDIQYLESSHPLARLVRAATVETLLSAPARAATGTFSLRLAENMTSNANLSVFSLCLRPQAHFQSGQRVLSEDVQFSLERCRAAGVLPGVIEVHSRSERAAFDAPPYHTVRDWIDLKLDGGVSTARLLPKLLSRCPIVERESTSMFGEDFARATNLVGSGPFSLRDYHGAREVTLERASNDVLHRESSQMVTLRAMGDARQALTALRIGTLDAMFSNDQEVIQKSRADETLAVEECGEYQLITRHGFTLRCGDPFDLTDLRYVY